MYIRDAHITWIWIYDNSWKKVPTVELIYFFGKTLHKEHPGHACVRLSRVRYSLEICSMLYQHAVKSINKCLVITFQ